LSSVIRAIPPAECEAIAVHVTLDPDLGNLRMSDDKIPGWNDAIAAALCSQVERAVEGALRSGVAPSTDIDVPGIARIRLEPQQSATRRSVSGLAISPAAELRKILTNGLFRAAPQIPPDAPGVVVVQCEHAPGAALTRAVFETAAALKAPDFDRVAALLILPTQYLLDRRRPLLLLNGRCQHQVAELDAIRVLREAMRPIEA
jgi:hypothetical protein